jgi:hypothetical protein
MAPVLRLSKPPNKKNKIKTSSPRKIQNALLASKAAK